MNSRNNYLQSYQKWAVGNDIRRYLMADTAITATVGNNIYPIVAPEGVNGNFIVYQRDKYSKSWSKMGVYEDDCQVFVTIVSDNYDTAIRLAGLVDNALVGDHKETTHEISIDLVDSTENWEDNKYIETLLLKIK